VEFWLQLIDGCCAEFSVLDTVYHTTKILNDLTDMVWINVNLHEWVPSVEFKGETGWITIGKRVPDRIRKSGGDNGNLVQAQVTEILPDEGIDV
jgi:hypothetical protein